MDALYGNKAQESQGMPFLVNNNEEANEADANADAVNEADVNVDAIQPPHPLDGLKDCFVCSNSIALLLNYGRFRWKKCLNVVELNIVPVHGNKGKVSGMPKLFAVHVNDDLHEFFHQIKQFGTPKATRFVREETGSGLRDGEEDLIELPISWSKRAVYARFCFERGFVINTDDRGCITKTTRTDGQWNAGDEKRICDWHTFLIFWDKHYPLARIAPPSTDICTDCHIFLTEKNTKELAM